MGQKKNSKIILIVIILLVALILLTGVAYVYFATDIFKSNKELFFKYMTQMGDENKGIVEGQLKKYFEKQKNTPYRNDGNITMNINGANKEEQFESANHMNLIFNGQVDTVSSRLIQNISLNYSSQVQFPLTYKKIGDIAGIQTNYIGSKYVAIDRKEDGLIEETNALNKIEEFTNVSLNKEELQSINDTYLNVLNQELQNSNFSKVEENNSEGYRLTLDGEKLKEILVKLLETLRNDQLTLDKINKYIEAKNNSLKMTTNNIDNAIRSINNSSYRKDENLEITVYQSKGKTNVIHIKMKEIEFKLEKILAEDNLQYNIELQINDNNEMKKIQLFLNFAGLNSMENIMEDYQLILEAKEIQYRYNYQNNVQFVNQVNIEEFNNTNSLILNDLEEEQRSTFINAIIERIQAVNQSHMEELGLEESENPLQYVIPTLFFNSNINKINEVEVNAFNQKFENYESTNLQGVTVKGLLSTIQLNNESQEDKDRKIKEIHFDGEEYEVTDQNIVFLKSSVEIENYYRVEFERDEDTGIIYRAVINKK